MKVIGITGGVGAGKSTILSILKENTNCIIIMADDLAKSLCLKGERCYEPLIELLGRDVLEDSGEINKSKMADRIFNNPSLLEAVNGIIHPAVKCYIKEQIESEKTNGVYDYFFIEAALLIEDGYKEIVDEMWYIYTSEEVRRKRLKESRGYSDSKIDNILKSQLSDKEFRDNSDFVIDNSNSKEDSFLQIMKWVERVRNDGNT